MDLRPKTREALLNLARQTIREALSASDPSASGPATTDNPELLQPAGCFVSLHSLRTHQLRGCVGRLDATDALWRCVRHSAVSVLEDPRFYLNPVTEAELPELELEISVLSPLRPATGPLDFDPLNDGIYLIHGNRAGCFLPQVARETGWTKQQLLARLCTEKMGLAPDAWQDPEARLMLFATLVIGPEPFERGTSEPTRARVSS